jgi:sugar lactone lactonase YvrE
MRYTISTLLIAAVVTTVGCRPRPPLVFDEPVTTSAAGDTTRVVTEARGAITVMTDERAVRAVPPPAPPPRTRRIAFVGGLKHPESILHDADQDLYFVSNMDGPSAMKDGRGFIARVRPDGTVDELGWVASGKGDVTLDAPKGMAITGDTLWVTDIDVVRGFDRRTGAPVTTINLSPYGAVFLNDLVAAPNGALYVTDTQIVPDERGNVTHPGADRLFRIGPDRAVSTALSSDRFMRPNGIALDKRAERFLIVSFGGDTIFAWKPGSGNIEAIAAGPGQFDGIEIAEDGRVFITSQSTASLWELRGDRLFEVILNLPGAADLGYDAKRRRLMVPLTGSNRVEIYEVP